MKLLLAIGLLFTNPGSSTFPNTLVAENDIPAYAKWSRLALKEATKKYPNAKIIDYLYVSTVPKEDKTTATFQLWLKEDDKEFGVIVKVTYKTVSEEVIKVEFEEFSRPVWKNLD